MALSVAAAAVRGDDVDWAALHSTAHEALAGTDDGAGDDSIALWSCLRATHREGARTLRSIG